MIRFLLCGLVVSSVPSGVAWASPAPQQSGTAMKFEVKGSKPRVNRRVTGPVQVEVQGVPAEPVDSFVYDGKGSTRIDGSLVISVDPVADVGTVSAEWEDVHGKWTYRMDVFYHPEFPSGVRIGTSASTTKLIILDPVVTDVYMHGDTTAGLPNIPTVHATLAAWGPAVVTLNGQPFDNPFDGPFLPLWEGHFMVTYGVRDADGSIRSEDGEIFDPDLHAAYGLVDYDDLEVHLTFHDMRFPNTSNLPDIHSFFYHLVFEQVTVETKHHHKKGEG